MSELRLHATLEPKGPAAAIVLTDEQVAELSTAKAFPVTVTIGDVTGPLRLARMGGLNLIGFSKANRAHFGVEPGQEVDAIIAVDSSERTVEVPPLLAQALAADPAAAAAFEALSFTNRKEMAVSIAGAKQEATRQRRLEKALSGLRAGS